MQLYSLREYRQSDKFMTRSEDCRLWRRKRVTRGEGENDNKKIPANRKERENVTFATFCILFPLSECTLRNK